MQTKSMTNLFLRSYISTLCSLTMTKVTLITLLYIYEIIDKKNLWIFVITNIGCEHFLK